ncbi:Zinc finger protein ZXDC [Dissostichus eleginoides]|uniref:Zinc finger protein ZXDC n=1 Tax=Dissostichus eleginoides TaxID=100907 RepID=A0AAD9FKK8_DISEL|nr:Zinc finger protein ZXDC [Dissostichus eleginoides]
MMKQLPLLLFLPLLPLLLLFSLLTGNSSACTNADGKVISTEGTDVILPCSPSTRENLLNKLFDWKKVGQGGDTQHEVFMYDSAVHYERHSGQSEQFKGRVSHFQNELKHGNASIFIRKTKVIDSGSYTCVFPHLKPDEEFCIELVVGASPEPSVTILEETKGWSLLQCLVRGSFPKPKVEWQDSSGNMVPAAEPQVSERGGSYDVILQTTVTKTDNYSCVASQEEIKHQSKPAHIYVHLSGAASKPHVLILDQTKDQSLLQCEILGAFPKPLLQWRDSSGNMVPAAEPQVSERGGSYDVILQTTVTKTDNYSCVASQEEIKHQSKPAHIYVPLSGEQPERSSVLGAGFFVVLVVLVVGGVVVVRVVSKDRIKLNQLNEKIEKLEDEQKKTSSQDTLPAESKQRPCTGETSTANRTSINPTRGSVCVVFKDDEATTHTPDVSSEERDKMKGKGAELCSMEAGNSEVILCDPNDCVDKKTDHVFNLLSLNDTVNNQHHHTVEDVVLTNKYGDKICGLQQEGVNTASSTGPGSAAAGETFSGTITINNQSIIVTIENGILTLAAPRRDMCTRRTTCGTKSIGKISTLAVTNQQEEPRAGLSVSESDLALVDDCSLSDHGTSLGAIVKQEAGGVCAVTEADLKLKVHLLNHAEDPRPYQCTVQGCGWAFGTSYKLKRHLQSHDKQRPHTCQFEGCGRRFTTVYNLKAHVKVHEQDNAFTCEICSERFRSATRLTNHQRVHFEPQRPHKCEFPGCEKTFITFSALFSHNRTHFRETGHFTCSFPGCDKTYDKACRLKIHMRSHTGERPFVCDSGGCGWSFTSMSKLLRHKRKHDDDRRFVCTEEGCGKSFTRAEHLKGHSITHLGTKPFQCHAEGCNAKFSARSSLYIHSKKHKQEGGSSALRSRCPLPDCSKHFSSRSSMRSHMIKHHHLSPDILSQMETTPSLTPSSELISSAPATVAGPCVSGGDQLTNLDLSSLFSAVPGGPAPPTALGVSIPVGSVSNSTFTMDLSLVSAGILTIDSVSSSSVIPKTVDPLILASGPEMAPHHGLEGDVLPPQVTLNLDDVQTVSPEALGNLTSLTNSLEVVPVSELLSSPSKVVDLGVQVVDVGGQVVDLGGQVVDVGGQVGTGPLLGCVDVLGPDEGGKVLSHGFLESGGSARTDYRAIQLAKKKKQRGPAASSGASGPSQRKSKGGKAASGPSAGRYGDGAAAANGGLTLRDPVTGAQYVQIQLLQLSSQPSSSHAQLTADLPVNILQEPSVMTEDDNNSDNSQFTGSTINLQDLE